MPVFSYDLAMKPSLSWQLPLTRNGMMSFFVILWFNIRISSVFRESRHTGFIWWAIGTQLFSMHVHNLYDTFTEQPCILDGGQKAFSIVIQQSHESWCHFLGMSCNEFRTVSPTACPSCLNSQMQTLVYSLFCEKLDYWIIVDENRCVVCIVFVTYTPSQACCTEGIKLFFFNAVFGPHLSCTLYSATNNTNMCSTWLECSWSSSDSILIFYCYCLFNDWS